MDAKVLELPPVRLQEPEAYRAKAAAIIRSLVSDSHFGWPGFAARMGVSPQVLRCWADGILPCSIDDLIKVCDVAGCPLLWAMSDVTSLVG